MDNVFQYILQLQNYQPMLTILTVLAAFLVGLYVFFIYRITFSVVQTIHPLAAQNVYWEMFLPYRR